MTKKKTAGDATPKPNPLAKKELKSFTQTFLVAAALTVIPVSLAPETWYILLNRFTANLAGNLIGLFPLDPIVRRTYITLDGFSVNVISECSAVHLIALFAAFLFAFPAARAQKWIGFASGVAILLSINIVRISLVTVVGSFFPFLFEAVHIYLGQLGMLFTTISICILWCRWVSNPGSLEGTAGYFVRFLLFSSLPFLLWLILNRPYVYAIDGFVRLLFSIAAYHLTIPHAHQYYYQTFGIVTLTGLLLAVREANFSSRLRWLGYGFAFLTLLQIAFRMCNVWITAFNIKWIETVSQVIYIVCVHAFPLVFTLLFLMRIRPLKTVKTVSKNR